MVKGGRAGSHKTHNFRGYQYQGYMNIRYPSDIHFDDDSTRLPVPRPSYERPVYVDVRWYINGSCSHKRKMLPAIATDTAKMSQRRYSPARKSHLTCLFLACHHHLHSFYHAAIFLYVSVPCVRRCSSALHHFFGIGSCSSIIIDILYLASGVERLRKHWIIFYDT